MAKVKSNPLSTPIAKNETASLSKKPSQTITAITKSQKADDSTMDVKRQENLVTKDMFLKELYAARGLLENEVDFNPAKEISKFLGIKFTEQPLEEAIINSPYGEYTTRRAYFSYEKLCNESLIDPINFRGKSTDHKKADLLDIYHAIEAGYQISPIIGYIGDNDKLYVIEGSRRRAAALIANVGLNVEILDKKPSPAFLTWLLGQYDAKLSQSYYEKGKMFENIMRSNGWVEQQELVKNTKYDKQEVSFCLSLLKIDEKIMDILPATSFSQSEARALLKINRLFMQLGEKQKILKNALELTSDIKIEDGVRKKTSALIAALASLTKVEKEKSVPDIELNGVKVNFRRQGKKLSISFENLSNELELKLNKEIRELLEKKL